MAAHNLTEARKKNAEYRQKIVQKLEESGALQALEEHLNSAIATLLKEEKYGRRKRLFKAEFHIGCDNPDRDVLCRTTAVILYNVNALDHFLERYRTRGWETAYNAAYDGHKRFTIAFGFYRIEKSSKKTAIDKQNEETNLKLQEAVRSDAPPTVSK